MSMTDSRGLRVTAQVPRLPDPHVPRGRIIDAIRAVAPGRSCLISAPAGYGATTAAAGAVAGEATWLDAAHAGGDAALLALVREAAGATGWLVVDGLPRESSAVWDELAVLARRLPAQLRLLITTPHRPPVGWEVLAAENGCVHLDAAAMTFSADEAVELLQAWHAGLSVETLTGIVADAEGWAAALAAAGACARMGRLDRNWLRHAGAAQLFAEWLAALPAQPRDLLTATSVLDALSPDLVAAVTGDRAAPSVLLALDERLGYLAEIEAPIPNTGRWWRRHPLLTAALQQRARPDRRRTHSKAADWFEAHGDVARTMHHLVQAGRAQEAGEMLLQHQRELYAAGRAEDVLALYRIIPGGLSSRLLNLLVLGWGQVLSGDQDGATFTLAALEADLIAMREDPDFELPAGDPNLASKEQVTAQVDMLRAFLASYRADPRTMVGSGRAAADVLRQHPPTDAGQLAWVTILRGLIWSARFAAARPLAARLQEEPFPNEVIREAVLIPLQAIMAAIDGDIRRAAGLVGRTRSWFKQHGMDPMAGPQYAVLSAEATLACETGQTQRAIELATAIIERAVEQAQHGEHAMALTLRARARWALGDFPGAQADLARAREVALAACPRSAALGAIGLAQVTLHTATGDLVRAERVLDSVPRGEDWDMTKAATLLASQPATAVRMLESLAPQTPRARCIRHMLLATATVGSSRLIAQRHLVRAAAIAQEFGIALLLVEAAPQLVQLAAETAVEVQDDALLWALQQRDRYLAQLRVEAAVQEPPQPLSRGELQLIALLPSRSGNADIAAILGVSVNTVKTRLRRLYAKLGVGSRDEAVARAEQRGLLPPGAR